MSLHATPVNEELWAMTQRQFKNCDGISRREMIRAGMGVSGALSLPGIMSLQAASPNNQNGRSNNAVIFVEMAGGPTQFETWLHRPKLTELDGQPIPDSFLEGKRFAFMEDAALKKGYKTKIGRFPFSGNGKAIALGEPQGMINTVFDDKTGELLGAHMIGSEVTELIQGYTIAKTMECTEADLIQTIFAHPTLSEMMHESVLEAYNRSIHI